MRRIPHTAERGAHTRTDPAYAPNAEVFDGLTHDEIFRGVQAIDPSSLSAGAQSWQAAANGLADAVSQSHNEIRGAIADGWRGAAASTAAAAVAAFELHGQQMADVMAVVSQRLVRAAEAAEALRSAVGTPSGAQPDLAAALLDPAQATANIDTQKNAEGERLDVVRAMDTIYTTAFLGTGVDVPAFPDTAPAAQDSPPSGTPGALAAMPGATDPEAAVAAQAAATAASPADPAAPTPATPPVAGTPITPTALPANSSPLGASITGSGGTLPAGSTPAATRPATAAPAGLVGAAPTENTHPRGASVSPASAPAGAGVVTGAPRPGADRERRGDQRSGAGSHDALGIGATGTPTGPAGAGADTGAGFGTGMSTDTAVGVGSGMSTDPADGSGTDTGSGTSASTGTGTGGNDTSATGTGESAPGTRATDRDGEAAVGAGAGAGAVGGLMGGALAAGDTPRSGSAAPPHAARSDRDEQEEDDELDWAEEDFAFDELESEFGSRHGAGRGFDESDPGTSSFGESGFAETGFGNPGFGDSGYGDLDSGGGRRQAGELIGDMDPATPPVVGDWTEHD